MLPTIILAIYIIILNNTNVIQVWKYFNTFKGYDFFYSKK